MKFIAAPPERMQFHLASSKFSAFGTFFIRRFASRYQRRMELPDCKKIFVWKNNRQQSVEVQFGFKNSAGNVKQILMNRPACEPFQATKTRMELKLLSLNEPKSKRRKGEENATESATSTEIPENIQILPSGILLHENTTNLDVFYGCDSLNIGSVPYTLIRDLPIIEKLVIALWPIVGCPVIPSCDWKSDFIAPNVNFHWFVAEEKFDLHIIRDRDSGKIGMKNWQFVSDEEIFTPKPEHTGKFLSVVVDFGEDLFLKAAMAKSQVIDVGEEFIFEKRQKEFCSSALAESNRLRLVCYNILADLYLDLRLEPSKLFFPYCPVRYQDAGYRYPVVLRELAGYNADILCLQEVDVRMQKRFLAKFLASSGFTTEFRCSAAEVNEGVMVAFRSSKFRMVESYPKIIEDISATPLKGVRISELADSTKYPENEDIAKLLNNNWKINEYLTKKATVLQVVHLESKFDPLTHLAVLNTHLTFDPAYEHIKLIQAILSYRYISRIRREIEESLKDTNAKIFSLFCGDLNSTPDSGVVKLCADGRVGSSSEFWGENAGAGIEINEGFKFTSLTGFPEYTNYTATNSTKGFVGCLDYIWSYPPMHVERVIPLPEHSLVTKHGAIPSKVAPSDHLALVCDVDLAR